MLGIILAFRYLLITVAARLMTTYRAARFLFYLGTNISPVIQSTLPFFPYYILRLVFSPLNREAVYQ